MQQTLVNTKRGYMKLHVSITRKAGCH